VHWRIHRHGEVDSTSERAFAALARGDARHGDVHVATAQSAGRGRLGRRWESAPDMGLYLSVVLLPPAPGPPPPALTLAGGLGVLEGAEALGLRGAQLDWPNDLVVGAAKLAGVLVESRGFDPGTPCFVLGIGLNVRQTLFPAPLAQERAVTSLALEGLSTSPGEALTAVLAALGPRIDQALAQEPTLAGDFLQRTGLAGARVRVLVGTSELVGEWRGLSFEELTLQLAAGARTVPLAHVRSLAPLP
jgi:BirA family transcriptional regulator, biotin operon repressor / biotin---[acetyl-CoA-carboxylase] ligase